MSLFASAQHALEQAREYERRTAIQPDLAKVSEAAKTPETLWAFLLDPMTTYDDRMAAAAKAAGILPPSYIAKKIAVEMELDTEPPAVRALDELTIEGLRQTPWPWQVQRALRKIWIDRGHATGYEIARELPCGTDFEAKVVIRTLGWFPMTAESYGLLLNVIGNRDEAFRQRASIWLGMQVLDPPPFERDPKFADEGEVMAWMAEFHRWLESHRSELEKGAAAETIPIAAARARMDAVTLCR